MYSSVPSPLPLAKSLFFSDDFKTAFLQHSDRPEVVGCCAGENGPSYNQVEHPVEGLSGYSFSPELPPKPIGDFHVFSIRKAAYITGDLSVGQDGPLGDLWRIQNFIPMGVERGFVLWVSRDEGCHANGFRVELMLVESFEVGRLDLAERDSLEFTHGFCRTIRLWRPGPAAQD